MAIPPVAGSSIIRWVKHIDGSMICQLCEALKLCFAACLLARCCTVCMRLCRFDRVHLLNGI